MKRGGRAGASYTRCRKLKREQARARSPSCRLCCRLVQIVSVTSAKPPRSQLRSGVLSSRKRQPWTYVFVLTILRPPWGTKRRAGRFGLWRLVAIPHTCDRGPGGKRRCQGPLVAAPFHCFAGDPHGAYAEREKGECARAAVPPPIWLSRCLDAKGILSVGDRFRPLVLLGSDPPTADSTNGTTRTIVSLQARVRLSSSPSILH